MKKALLNPKTPDNLKKGIRKYFKKKGITEHE